MKDEKTLKKVHIEGIFFEIEEICEDDIIGDNDDLYVADADDCEMVFGQIEVCF